MMSDPFLVHGGEEKAADESERAITMKAEDTLSWRM
jgi:hypothetical protein